MERNISYDLMRIFACFSVIMVHTSGTGLMPGRDYPILTSEWYTCVVFSSMVGWAVPLFVMLSGALFLNGSKVVNVKQLFGNNILRLFVILLVWTLLYVWWTNGNIFPLGSTVGHLWYLPMTIALYMAIPILRALPLRMRDYFIVLWVIWLIVDYICRYVVCNPFAEFEHQFFSGYVGYFLLGDWCRRHCDSMKLIKGFIIAGVISILVIIFTTIWNSILKGETTLLLSGYFSPFIVVTAVGTYYLCTLIAPKMSHRGGEKIVSSLASLTLGIYLVHMEILIQIYTRVQRFISKPILLIPIVCGITFVGGAIITYIIKKIPYINKYIV